MPKLPDSGFTRVAPFYDALARLVYGEALEQAQLALLPFVPQQARVLIIGGGSGWLLGQLLHTGKRLEVLYLDAAPGMLRSAQKKFGQCDLSHKCRVSFRLGTEEALQPQEQFDVIFTPFLLDLFPPLRLRRLMNRLDAALAPAGLWLFADFWPIQQPPRWWQRCLEKAMYTFFRVASGIKGRQFPKYGRHFAALGFQEKHSRSFYGGMVQAKVFST